MLFRSTIILTAMVVTVQGMPQLQRRHVTSTSNSENSSMTFSDTSTASSSVSVTSSSISPTSPSPAPVPTVTNGPSIAASLLDEPSSVDRFSKLLTDGNGNLLSGDALRQLTVFDFNQQKPAAGAQGGSILMASIDNFPILTDLSISGAVSFIGPCGLNIPHSHPRADEFFVLVKGVLKTGFVLENGFNHEIPTELSAFQATVFPKGSIHYQQNPTCDEAVFVAGFGNNDPGRSDVVTNFWMLNSDVIDASLGFPSTIGGDTIDQWRSHLPVNLALGVDSCLQACGIRTSGNNTASN